MGMKLTAIELIKHRIEGLKNEKNRFKIATDVRFIEDNQAVKIDKRYKKPTIRPVIMEEINKPRKPLT